MFSVQLSLGEQTWESEGSSIKKAQQAVANKALTESTLPKPVQKPPKSNVNNNPGMALTWFLVFCPLHVLFPVFSFTQACCIVSGCSDSRTVTEDERMKKVVVVILKFCFNGYSKGALLIFKCDKKAFGHRDMKTGARFFLRQRQSRQFLLGI